MRQPSVLILSIAGDVHLYAVKIALERKGAQVRVWYTADFPSLATESVEFSKAGRKILLPAAEATVSSTGATTVWNRRVTLDRRHEALKIEDCEFAEIECHRFRESFLRIVEQSAFWVNPRRTALEAENKLWQHHVAETLALKTPDSLYTNDPEEIRRFLRRHDGSVIYKPFIGSTWEEDGLSLGCYTSKISEERLPEDKILQAVPGIYQEVVPKAYELRLTMIGARSFCVKIFSQGTTKGRLDWRRAYDEIRIEPVEAPEKLVEACRKLLNGLGLVFGCFDFVVTPRGEVVFLEVNQQGQFLFVEDFTGMPLLDAFTEFLLQADPDFDWEPGPNTVRYEDVKAEALAAARKSIEIHHGLLTARSRRRGPLVTNNVAGHNR